MSFTKNMPNPSDFLSVSQSQFLINNQVLVDATAIDHVSLEDGTAIERLKHTALHLKEQSIDPTTLVDEGGLFVKQDAGQDDLYYRHENNGEIVKLTSGGGTGGNILALCNFDGRVIGTNPPNYGSNVTSIQRDSRGLYTIIFTKPLSDTNYIVTITTDEDPANGLIGSLSNRTVNDCQIVTSGVGLGRKDPSDVYISVIG